MRAAPNVAPEIATVAAARTDVLARPVMGVERKRQTRDPKRAICSGRIRMQLYPYGGISLFAISAFNLHTPSDRILAGCLAHVRNESRSRRGFNRLRRVALFTSAREQGGSNE